MDRFKQILTDINETLVSNRTQATKHLVEPQENMDDDTREEAYEMAVASLKSIVSRAAGVLKKLEDPEKMDQIQQGLTEPWVQSKITLAEDYVRTIHDFVVFLNRMTINLCLKHIPLLLEKTSRTPNHRIHMIGCYPKRKD